jgi:hypothetical protein
MFCPQCGSDQSNELKFCKACGANLSTVRQALATRETGEKADWGKSWVTSLVEAQRSAELDRQRRITPEVIRYRETKAGIICASVGVGLGLFLYVFMQGVILSGNPGPGEAEILSRLWAVGLIPLFVGIGLLISARVRGPKETRVTGSLTPEQHSLESGHPSDYIPSNSSVTENTTKHLSGPERHH